MYRFDGGVVNRMLPNSSEPAVYSMVGSPMTAGAGVLSVSALVPASVVNRPGNRLFITVVSTVSDGAKSLNTSSPFSLPIARYCMSMNR